MILHNTAFTYKGKSADSREIGKELNVRYALEGSAPARAENAGKRAVGRRPKRRPSVGRTFRQASRRPLRHAGRNRRCLAGQLDAELIAAEARRSKRSANPNALDLYFQGMAWYNKGRNPEDVERARGFFERALALDPANLDAALGKAN